MTDKVSLNKLARQRAKRFSGGIAWPTIILATLVIPAYWLTPFLVAFNDLSLWLAIPLMAVLTYAAYTVLHESVHGSIRGSNTSLVWLNDGLGYAAGMVLMTPLTAHRLEHLSHHGHTNDGDKDPDQYAKDIVGSIPAALGAVWRAIATQYRVYFRDHWSKVSPGQNSIFVLEVVFAIALRLLPFIWLYSVSEAQFAHHWWTLLWLFLASGFIGTYVLVYLFAYIVHRPHTETERYRDTSSIVVTGPFAQLVTLLWGYQNYHAMHHLFPSVPFYHYQRLFLDITDILDHMQAPVYRLTWSGLRKIQASQCH